MPGESLAIMGPSGAGKSSMLNMLAGRVSKKCGVTMSHSIKFNGEASSPAHYGSRIAYVENTPSLQTRSFSPRSRATLTLRSFCRYVMQDDALFPTATVRETVMFAAFLRPGPFAACEFAKKRELVDMLLKALGLWGCRDTLIGNPPMITGVSGGEKRRVSIACELVTIPEILFLDEPTSGLDSFAAYQVVTALQSLAAAGCTVLCTIHQPSSEVFRLFDNTVLLVNGATVYHGRVDGMTDYFSSDAGGNIACPPGFNPADHFMFHVQKEPKAALQLMEDRWDARAARGGSARASTAGAAVFPETAADEKSTAVEVAAKGEAEAEGEAEGGDGGADVELPPTGASVVVPIADGALAAPPTERGKGADVFTQLGLLVARDLRNLYRDKSAVIGRMMITAVMSAVGGLIFFQVGKTHESDGTPDLSSHFGAMMMMCIQGMFGAAQPILLTFPLERPIFIRENAARTYSVVPYFVSKMITELPVSLAQSSLSVTIFWLLLGLKGNIGVYIGLIWAIGLAANSIALFVSCVAPSAKAAVEGAPLIFVPQIMFSGFFIRMELIPVWLRWIQHIIPLKYAVNLATIAEFGWPSCDYIMTLPQRMNATSSTYVTTHINMCDRLLAANDVVTERWFLYFIILGAIAITCRVLAGVALGIRARTYG